MKKDDSILPVEAAESVDLSPLLEMKDQRDRAFACAILSLAISIALITSNFPGNRAPIEAARAAVQIHRKLLSENQVVLRQNQDVLLQNQTELARLHKALGR